MFPRVRSSFGASTYICITKYARVVMIKPTGFSAKIYNAISPKVSSMLMVPSFSQKWPSFSSACWKIFPFFKPVAVKTIPRIPRRAASSRGKKSALIKFSATDLMPNEAIYSPMPSSIKALPQNTSLYFLNILFSLLIRDMGSCPWFRPVDPLLFLRYSGRIIHDYPPLSLSAMLGI